MLTLGFVKCSKGYVEYKKGGEFYSPPNIIFKTIQSAYRSMFRSIKFLQLGVSSKKTQLSYKATLCLCKLPWALYPAIVGLSQIFSVHNDPTLE